MVSSLLSRMSPQTGCHATAAKASGRPVLAIVGCPNVGKSVLFNRLTGTYVTVSNYPGTTVEVSRGKAKFAGLEVEVVDTPGMYSVLPISEEEAVARRLLLNEHPRQVLHVIDAKNLQRMLPMTLQLLEAGLPVVLALNMLDESEELGFSFDFDLLREQLGIPVLGTAGASNRGVEELMSLLGDRMGTCDCTPVAPPVSPITYIQYDAGIEDAIDDITSIIGSPAEITPRALALLLLQDDEEIYTLVEERVSQEAAERVRKIVVALQARYAQPLNVIISLRRQAVVSEIAARVMRFPTVVKLARLEWLSRLLMAPLTGLPVLALVLYFGIYKFVGVFGGGTLVDWLQHQLFGHWINPWITQRVVHWLPNPLWSNLFVGEYGIITLGITYAIAIVLPIVGLFFFVFAMLEDSGYLPRLAMLIDRLFKRIGLNGRAVIPLVLGFGCDTMATIVTRVLETKRERIITTLLLALAIPCAAQSGLFLAMLGAVQPYGLLIYLGILVIIFLVVGLLAAQLMPGQKAQFYIELPPLRLPRLGNVLVKTYSRLEWYFFEILPMFILASLVLWAGSLVWNGHALTFSAHHGLLGMVERGLDPLASLIGLPTSADVARNPALEFSGGTILVAGFFRRDFGAAGLWHLFSSGLITPLQVLVASVTLTLFLPCMAQFLVMKKERGLWTTLAMTVFIVVVAFGVGYLLRMGLHATGIHLLLDKAAIPKGY
ncbi:MAG TPA: ferrous iron transport protein B [Armatimonadota bacterium]|nr:ferrous iron transport protein B [Armatimonadota bacterium]